MPTLTQIDDAALGALEQYPPAAIAGFLKQQGIISERGGTQSIARVREALVDGFVTPQAVVDWMKHLEWADAALESVHEFDAPLPVIQAFCVQHGLDVPNVVATGLDRLRDHLFKDHKQLKVWMDYLDDERLRGTRHVFAFCVGDQDEAYLSKLRSEDYIRACITPIASEETYNGSVLAREKPDPTLVRVRHAPASVLTLVWAKSREWVANQADRKERALISVTIDLQDGRTNVELQRMRAGMGGMSGLKSELKEALDCLGMVLEIEWFKPTIIEPALRELLLRTEFRPTLWEVEIEDGGRLTGQNVPTITQSVNLAFQRFVVRRLNGAWSPPEFDEPIDVRLHGETGEMRIPGGCTEAEKRDLVRRVRELAVEALPENVAGTAKGPTPKAGGELEKLFNHIGRLRKFELSFRDLRSASEDLWIPYGELMRAIDELAHSEKGAVRFEVFCPKTGRPVTRQGHRVTYERLEDLPATIECHHDGVGRHVIQVAPNTRIRFKRPEKISQRFTPGRMFFVVFIALVIVTTTGFVYLMQLFEGPVQQALLIVGNLVVLVIDLAAAVRSLGRRNFLIATEVLKRLVGLSKKF
jgi:hypothetical protein